MRATDLNYIYLLFVLLSSYCVRLAFKLEKYFRITCDTHNFEKPVTEDSCR